METYIDALNTIHEFIVNASIISEIVLIMHNLVFMHLCKFYGSNMTI